MNKVILSGRIVKDIELKKTKSGESCVMNTIAVRREYKSANGEYESDFINFVVFRQQADYLNNYAAKGILIELSGRWNHRSYQTQNGGTGYADEVMVESISILEKKKEETRDNTYVTYDIPNDDLPF